MLAWLEDDPEMRDFYIAEIRRQSDCNDRTFALADCAARLFANGYVGEENRERVREHLTSFIQQMAEHV
jgi:hypothetical protein